ncbi:MAG: anaerobic ribonucleoside-triphosphate reductase activating protein [Treponema sp.]|jgi:pyruvate formate lyase activating enzyme|nr:anaerobic ribonucleoside-triphosphate reductase activating protein [Treponema sp.]
MVRLRKTSLVDYPGGIASVLFLPGCNLRCPWCQNRELVLQSVPEAFIPLEEALALIRKRRNLLDGVVVSGGEPSIYPALGDLIAELHGTGLPVKLDTNGMNPRVLKKICGEKNSRPDYIALDLKLAPGRYRELLPSAGPEEKTGPASFDPAAALTESAALVRASGIPHEYRSLALPGGYFGAGDVEALSPLADGGPWYFRPFSPGNCLDPAWNSLPPTGEKETAALAETAKPRLPQT